MRLEVRLLGRVDVVLDGRRLGAFTSRRMQRFLGLIALRRDPQHRSRLAFELWPDSTERQARTNLRKLLHEFRQSLPDTDQFVEIGKDSVRWLSDGPSTVDVLRFLDALAAGDLELAAHLYAGDLLPGFYDDWVEEQRGKLRSEALNALARLSEDAANREDRKATIKYAQRIMDLEPTDEAAMRMQMEACLALDDKAAALRSYQQYAQALERDLGVAPSATIDKLYQQARATTTDRGEERMTVLASAGDSPFTGREQEWQRLSSAWTGAQTVAAHLVLVTGEPGIGKSRLAAEFGRSVRAAGHMVASARAYEAAGRLPWGPVVELLRSSALRGEVEALDPAWRTELARLLPELGEPESHVAKDQTADPVRRHRLFDAVRTAVASGDMPRLLIIDDLQWCDTETIELIGFIVSSARMAPLMIIGTVRSEELPQQHSLNGLIDSLDRNTAVTILPLEPLDQAATEILATGLTDDEQLDPELTARLWRETQGNPLFVIEAIRAGIEAGADEAVITPTIRAILRARLDKLPEAPRQLTEVAAVFGRQFSASLLARAAGIEESEALDQLDELWRRQIIREQGPNYDFSHDTLRAVALDRIGAVRRRRLHQAVAEALTAELGDNAAAASPQLAAHYDQAGMVDAAIDAYRTAGRQAVAVSAPAEAIRMFERALSMMADLPPSADRDELELDTRVALGSPLVAVVGYGSKNVHQLYERARALCRKLRRPVHPPILRGLGLARLQGCRFDNCDELAQALLEHAGDDPVTTTEGHYLRGVSAFWRGDLALAREGLTQAIESFDESRGDEHLALYAQDPKAVCRIRLAWAELWAGDISRSSQTARSALERAEDLDHLMTRVYVITYAAIVAAEAGDDTRLAELLAEADRVWEQHSERYLGLVLDALRGWMDVRSGSAAGIERIVDSVARSRTEGETLHLTYTLLLLARSRGVLGDYREGRAAAQEGLSLTRQRNQGYLEAEMLRVDGELAYGSGDAEAAGVSLQASVDVARAQGAGWLEKRALESQATLHAS